MNRSVTRASARRLLTRSRAVWTAVAVAVMAAAAVVVTIDLVRFAVGVEPWLLRPRALLELIAGGSPLAIALGVAAAVFGVTCLWGALVPGRAGRRLIEDERAPIVIDDDIVAGSLSRGAARVADVGPGQVTTRLTRRAAEIRVTPTTGFPVDASAVTRGGEEDLRAVALRPTVRTRATVDTEGVLA